MAEKKSSSAAHIAVVVMMINTIYTGMFLLSKAALNLGMNFSIFVFYRQAFATSFLAPITIALHWKSAPPLCFMVLIKIFLLALVGVAGTFNIYGVALKYTSASLAAAAANTLPVITFFLALLFRMEKVNVRASSGLAKLAGVAICMAGVAVIAFYKGPSWKIMAHHNVLEGSHGQGSQQAHSSSSSSNNEDHHHDYKTWIKGVFLMLLSDLTWGLWLVLQGPVLKRYPSKLVFTTLVCFFSTIQTFLIAITVERNPTEWKLGWDVRLLSVAYCGIMVTGVTFYLQTWVIEKKGAVFLAMTAPLAWIFTLISSAILLGEMISLGSVVGAILLVGALYCELWGKSKEQKMEQKDSSTGDLEKVCTDGVSKETTTKDATTP